MGTPSDPDTNAVLPEAQARTLLRDHAEDGLEAWLADQRWRSALDGWLVEPEGGGCTYRMEEVPGFAVRVVKRAPGAVTSWLIV